MWKPRKRHKLTRQELFDLVWSGPISKIAPGYGISGTGLAKICRNAGIPLPERGHWNRVQAGHKVYKPRLKPAKEGQSETLFITQGDGPRPKPPPTPPLEPEIVRAIEAERSEKNRIVVPDEVHRLHPEVKRIADDWAIRTGNWNNRNLKLDPLEARRRRIMNTFFRAIEARGGSVSAKRWDSGFEAALFGTEFSLSCTEPERRVRVPMTREELKKRSEWERRDYNIVSQPTGVLRMRVIWKADQHKDFVDKENAPLETQLNDVIVYLLEHTITEAERDRRAEAARVAAAEAAARQADAELRRIRDADLRRREKERADALVERSERWHKARRLRAFVAAVAAVTGRADEPWLAWARGVADVMDPLTTGENLDPPTRQLWWENEDS
jgi:hypothetical protein